MGSKRLTVQDLNSKMVELNDKFTAGLMDFKKELEGKFSSLPVSPTLETGKNDLLMRFGAFENCMRGIVDDLKLSIERLNKEMKKNQNSLDLIWQKYNCSLLVIHGIKEGESNMCELHNSVLEFLNKNILSKMPENHTILSREAINQCYRFGKKSGDRPARPIAVQFSNVWVRNEVFYNKKLLRGSRTLLTEMLTKETLHLYKQVRAVNKSAWTFNGRIYVAYEGKRTLIGSQEDVDALAAGKNRAGHAGR